MNTTYPTTNDDFLDIGMEIIKTVHVDLTRDRDVAKSLGDMNRLKNEFRDKRSIFSGAARTKVLQPPITTLNNVLSTISVVNNKTTDYIRR